MSNAFEAGREVLVPMLRGSDPREALVAAKCLGLLRGYDARWVAAPYRIDAVECVMTSDLYNPETTRKSRSFSIAGKIDVRATELATGAKIIFDHKTASQEITDYNAPYWRQLVIEGQVSHYMLLEWLNSNKVDYGIWDVIRKPSISPKAVAKKDVLATVEDGAYFGTPLTSADLNEFADNEHRETPLLYSARLAYDCITERPEWYFQRRRVPRLDSEVREYAQELWGHGQDILAVRQSGRHPRNSGACFTYNSPCEYLAVCSGYDTINSGAWVQKAWVHNELPILEGRGIDVLTNSRIRMFQTCRQKHHFRYELGVEKVDEEEKESRFFGTLFHAALEQFFLTLQKEQTA